MNWSRQVSDPAALLAALTPQDKYQIARLLEQAGEFENHEWTQGATARTAQGHSLPFLPEMEYGKNPPVQFCAVGHIARVSRQNNQHGRRGILMTAALSRQVKRPVPDWNDQPDTNAEKVRAAFRQAAARLYREAAAQALCAAPTPEKEETPLRKPAPAKPTPAAPV